MSDQQSGSKKLPLSFKIFIFIEVLLYISFTVFDIILSKVKIPNKNPAVSMIKTGVFSPDMLKYYSIIICLIFSTFIYLSARKNKSVVQQPVPFSIICAMFFTAVSDFFVLLNPGIILPGLISFCIVHGIYLYIILGGKIKETIKISLIRIILSVVIYIIIKNTGLIRFPNDSAMNSILIPGILYAFSFIGNVIRLTLSVYKHDKASTCLFRHPKLFLWGLVLFLMCDLNVVIFNLESVFSINSDLYRFLLKCSEYLMWGFYLPAQVIIVLSAVLGDLNTNKNTQ